MNPTLRECLEGRISPEIAVAHFLFVGEGADKIAAALDAAPPHPRLEAVRTLLLGRERTLDALAAQVVATVADHNAFGATPAEGIARVARFFDQAVASSPEASVALYSLGDPAILAAATAEILEWLTAHDLLAPEADVLDLGCGIGRMAAGLAPRCRSVLGTDVSAGMLAEARRRHADLETVRFEQTSGLGLPTLQDASRDLVLAVDIFPYFVQAGEPVLRQHFLDVHRVLRPGGALVILNFSYEQDDLDPTRVAAWAEQTGFVLALHEPAPFRLWDGEAFVLRR